MDKKFLAEHHSKCRAEYKKYKKKLIKNPSEKNPAIVRMGKMRGPVIMSEPHIYNYDKEKIWSQIPFAGTLIISLFNVPKEMCLLENGFEASDIPDLVRLAKETGKIKFGFQTNPLSYEGLDYLDPIIEEFEPPVLYAQNRFDEDVGEEKRKKWYIEYRTIGSIKYFSELQYNVLKSGGNEKFVDSLISGRGQTWEWLKVYGTNEEIEALTNAMVDNPREAEMLFSAYIMQMSPMSDPITKNYNYSLGRLKQYKLNTDLKSNIKIPEIGRLLLNKLVLNPGNYYGCIEAIKKYEDSDLYKLLESFENAIMEKNNDKGIESKKALEDVIENVWNDVKITSSQIKNVKSGLSIALGIGGSAVTTAAQGVAGSDPGLASIGAVGLLAGLGFNTFENRFTLKKNISERLVRAFKPNYLINMLDFSKKYDIK